MKRIYLSLVALSMSLVVSGCGGGGGDDTASSAISNVGNNINSLGYYSGTTMFGTLTIERGWTIYNYPTDETVVSLPSDLWYFDQENEDMWQKYEYPDGFYNAGRYGVNDNGNTLYITNYSDQITIFNYISMTNVTTTSDETYRCIKMSNGSSIYAMCPLTN